MKNQKVQCFDEREFRRFLDEQSSVDEEAEIVNHLETCRQCRQALESLSGESRVGPGIEQHLGDPSPGEEETRDLDAESAQRGRQRELRKIKDLLVPSEYPEMIGRLGGYEVCGVIGRGSAGIVVKALDPRLNRYVAIKLLAPAYSNNGCSRRRFEREGRAIASVKDPHVVPIHAVDDFQGTPYIVMQYLPDGSLFQRLKTHGPLSTDEVVCVGMHVAKGLAAAHKRGIVHRDVKPANVLLENGLNNAMVTDFGLARVVDEATMTRSGSISGTPQYMSPEQAKGERVDPRSDLFSLGSVMYAACTGHAPFKSESVFGVIKRVCESDPLPIHDYNPDIASWLVALIDRLHSKDPQDRFESADDVAEILSRELSHIQSPNMVSEPDRPWWVKPVPSLASKAAAAASRPWYVRLTTLAILASIGLLAGGWIGWHQGWLGATSAPGKLVDATKQPFAIGEAKAHVIVSKPGIFDPSDANLNTLISSLALPGQATPSSLLAITTQENQELERFSNSFETTIDVQSGGSLLMRSNLGRVTVATHDQPTVVMKLVHTVGAKDKETAAKLFKAVKLEYNHDHEAVGQAGYTLTKEKDATIVAEFPIQKLTQEEIAQANDLEELKEQLLIRNNSHYRNAEFHVTIPTTFNIDLQTSAGPIETGDIDGTAKLFTAGGGIRVGTVSQDADIQSHGGSIDTQDLKGDAKLLTHGGHIETGNVAGSLTVESHGGHLEVGRVKGDLSALTHGGRVEIEAVEGTASAKSHGGRVVIWKAHRNVTIDAPAGSIRVNFVKQPDKPSACNAQSGSVRIGYLKGIGFQVDANTRLGSIRGPFVDGNPKQLAASFNKQTTPLTVQTMTGSIRFEEVNLDELEGELNRRRAEQGERREQAKAQAVFNRAYDIHMAGRIEEALIEHRKAAEFESHRGIATYNVGCALALLGRKDEALQALEQAVEYGFRDQAQFETDSDLDTLRSTERFKAIMDQLKREGNQECNGPCDCEDAVEV